MRRVYIIGDNNTVTSDASGIVLINCDGEAVTSEDNDSVIINNRAFVVSSTGHSTGTIGLTRTTKNADFIAGTDAYNIYFVDCSGGDVDVTIELNNIPLFFVKTDASVNKIVLTPDSGTINGVASYDVTAQYQKVYVLCDGTDFYV